MKSFLSSNLASEPEKTPWFNITKQGGACSYGTSGSWFNWNDYGYWWSEDSNDLYCYYTGGGFQEVKRQQVSKNKRAHKKKQPKEKFGREKCLSGHCGKVEIERAERLMKEYYSEKRKEK